MLGQGVGRVLEGRGAPIGGWGRPTVGPLQGKLCCVQRLVIFRKGHDRRAGR